MYDSAYTETASIEEPISHIVPVETRDKACMAEIRIMFRGYNPEDWTVYTFPAREADRNTIFDQVVGGLKKLGYEYVGSYHWRGWYRYLNHEGRICAVRSRLGGIDVAHYNATGRYVAGILS